MVAKRCAGWILLGIVLVLTACGPGQASVISASPTPSLEPTPTARATSTGTPTPPMQQPVLVDTDMALDDWMALLFLLRHASIDVVAITISGSGETHCAEGVRHAAGLVALAQHSPIPIACGREAPLQGDHTFPQDWRNASDNLLGLSLPEGSNPVEPGLDAPGLILQSARIGHLTILTLGPLTNLAEALQTDPSLAQRIYRIYIMGGAVDVPGNLAEGGQITDNLTAEWNIFIDPRAANIVFHAGAQIVLVPLDATNTVPLTFDFYQRLQSAQDTPVAIFVYQTLSQIYDIVAAETYFFWDPLAAAILVDETLAQFEARQLCVQESEGSQSGQLVESDTCPALKVATWANAARFEDLFLYTLLRKFDPANNTDALAGAWRGSAQNGDLIFEITINLQTGCAIGQICGYFEIPDFSCSGEYRLAEINGSRYRFSGENQTSACTLGSEDWLELLPDGTLLYTSRHPSYGQSQGILTNK